MKSRLALTLALSAAMWTTTGAQAQKERCGTRQPSLEESEQIELKISRARKVRTDVTDLQRMSRTIRQQIKVSRSFDVH